MFLWDEFTYGTSVLNFRVMKLSDDMLTETESFNHPELILRILYK